MNIIHPGNGVDFPKSGDYVKINLVIKTGNHNNDHENNILFSSKETSNKFLEIRFYEEVEDIPNQILGSGKHLQNITNNIGSSSGIISILENLIKQMSLFEKCSLELDIESKSETDKLNIKKIQRDSFNLENLLRQYKKLIFEVEIVDISKFPHI